MIDLKREEEIFKVIDGRLNEKDKTDIRVKDGIVCQEKYRNILFLLKEVYDDWSDCNYSLLEFLRGNKHKITNDNKNKEFPVAKTWSNVARWTCCALTGEDYHPGLADLSVEERIKWVSNIAVVNIYKGIRGASYSPHAHIKEWAERCKDQLRQQIELYEPKIVICGGTGDYLKDYIIPFEAWEPKVNDGYRFKRINSYLVIDSYHPGWIRSKEKLYKYLFNTLKACHFSA